ncbi:hypothetical protein [Tenacibaculum jejuense]|uniref:Uncharacterized protein n=1 Tax=Tenacibaculum jejuense TaxID=584609 RepID=A0A238UAB6_9FLAO|nr:hypothetical protein [Tenacibaculum jejuense]SNR15508.1 membrane protein of unknown function [Tenacibaculum jejuense]
MEKSTENSAKQWLQRLKDESWEAELLVSAVAIFGTFKLFGIIGWLTNKFIDIISLDLYFSAYMVVFFGLFAISILASMFVIHFSLRAYWIGLVGLNSVFPDYSIEDSAYSKIYTEKMLEILPKLKDSIEKVDELCSVIFSVAFTFLLIYSYFSFLASIYILTYNAFSETVDPIYLLIPLFILGILFVLQMFLSVYANLKNNKEKSELQIFTFKVNKFVSMVTFGPLYKSILQVSMIFGSNFKKKKRLVLLMLVFIFSGAFTAIYQISETNILYLINPKKYHNNNLIRPVFYADTNSESTYLIEPEIESEKIDHKLFKVFIPLFTYENRLRRKICKYTDEDLDSDNKNEILQNCYKTYVTLKVNDKKILAPNYIRQIHHRTGQFGIVTYINTEELAMGQHYISIKKGEHKEWKIPFFLEK